MGYVAGLAAATVLVVHDDDPFVATEDRDCGERFSVLLRELHDSLLRLVTYRAQVDDGDVEVLGQAPRVEGIGRTQSEFTTEVAGDRVGLGLEAPSQFHGGTRQDFSTSRL